MHKNDVFQTGRIKFATWVLNTNTDSWVPAQNSNQNPQDQSSSGNMKLELGVKLGPSPHPSQESREDSFL